MLIPLPALLPWDKWLGLEAKTVRAVTVLLVVIAAFASWHMVEQWTGRLDGTVAGWGVAIFVVGMLVIGWRWAFVSVLALLMIGVGGWDTIQESFTGARVRSSLGVYTVTASPQTNKHDRKRGVEGK